MDELFRGKKNSPEGVIIITFPSGEFSLLCRSLMDAMPSLLPAGYGLCLRRHGVTWR
ncbi:hypothetical protein [Corynebacterium matruchotii]|uniref:hypothetical protein n=1 Tax=Corynebacterium matruchotii TaxID=43768 RepID=UPI0028E84253|nr:hypothetical protein [Corynebacterium matruchotii]